MPPTVAHELYDIAIDFLHDDRPALCNVSLVSRSWLPAARFHLFSRTHLAPSNIHSGLEVICAVGSTIPPYILHLEIVNVGTRYSDEILLRFPPLRNLMSLWLEQIDWKGLSTSAKERLPTILQNLTTLSLSYISFENVNQAAELIASAPSLEKLSMWCNNYDDNCKYSSQKHAPALKWIQFGADLSTCNLLDWFCHCHPAPRVHTFVACGIYGDAIPTVCRHIRHLGSALENISISCPGLDREGTAQILLSQQIDLTHNTSLRHIIFDSLVLYAAYSRGIGSCSWIILMVSQITHHSLKSVTLNISLGIPEEINSLDLAAFDILFRNPILSWNSTKLCFIICGDVDRDAARAMIKDGLRELDQQGRLEFHAASGAIDWPGR